MVPFQVYFNKAIPNPTFKLKNAPAKQPVIAIIPSPILANWVFTKKSQAEFPNAKNVMPKYDGLIPVKVYINCEPRSMLSDYHYKINKNFNY